MEDSPKEQALYHALPEAFRFLFDYGFTMQKREFGAFVAKSEKCFIEISLDWEGINIRLSPNNINPAEFETQPQTIELSHVIRCPDPHAAGEPSYTRSSFGVPEIVSEVHRRAELLKHYSAPFLVGDFSSWQKIRECVDDWLDKYSPLGGTLGQTVGDDRHLATVRRLAEKAWQEKKYQGVVFLYRSIREYVTPDEAQRLEYAYEHVRKALILVLPDKSVGLRCTDLNFEFLHPADARSRLGVPLCASRPPSGGDYVIPPGTPSPTPTFAPPPAQGTRYPTPAWHAGGRSRLRGSPAPAPRSTFSSPTEESWANWLNQTCRPPGAVKILGVSSASCL